MPREPAAAVLERILRELNDEFFVRQDSVALRGIPTVSAYMAQHKLHRLGRRRELDVKSKGDGTNQMQRLLEPSKVD